MCVCVCVCVCVLSSSYSDNEEFQPAPGVSEVFPESKADPLEKHLHEEEEGEHQLGDGQHRHQDLTTRQVNVLKCLQVDTLR